MNRLSAHDVRSYLRASGQTSARQIEQVIDGFDFDRPVYYRQFEEGEHLFQYIRNPSRADPLPRAGNWFCLRGATTSGLAITDGLSGRRLHRYRVVATFTAIEGCARPQSINWDWAGGGKGGATQVYVPASILLSSLTAVGAANR